MSTDTNVVVHENPVWRKRANFIIAAQITDEEIASRWQWEQLWARQITDNRFEICCIPFFIYDLALGDEVETDLDEDARFMVRKVVRSSGHCTFRIWFLDQSARDEIPREIARLGCLMEWRWSSSNLLAVDAASGTQAHAVADLLWHREHMGHLEYETGRT